MPSLSAFVTALVTTPVGCPRPAPASTNTNGRPYQGYPYTTPIVIDAPSVGPGAGDRWRNLPRRPADLAIGRPNAGESSRSAEETGAQAARSTGSLTPDFVADTILYDPFEDRRIDVQKSTTSGSDFQSIELSNLSRSPSTPASPPFVTVSSPAGEPSSSRPGPSATSDAGSRDRPPPMLSKEAYVYNRQTPQEDGFRLSPLPVSDFPDPPPAYTEIDRVVTVQPTAQAPPRTEVVTQQTGLPPAAGVLDPSRKFLICQHCGNRVHTLVIKESGAATHILAWSCMLLCMFPVTALVYCTNACKYKNHYCPACNRLIGYEVPMLCQPLVKVT
ncbi:hypothetical protein EVAR_22268_1 [Eumeta japonica]|uniref:LITAF domain-containing protein n=1 Tax=Eumeta variegata TaxID=151549 RepID=A0A4C1UAR6_EUMVA|nr:hypothetical protein EVAR_22268_1 [Eumeta japonica]